MSSNPPQAPLTLVDQLRAFFFPRDRNVWLATGCSLTVDSGQLRSRLNLENYTAYPVVALATPLTSTSWDGDAKPFDSSGTIDLSSVFGAPAGIRGIFARLTAKDETTQVLFGLAVTGAANLALPQHTQVANAYITIAGFCPCDGNGDVYFHQDGELDYVQIQIYGYAI